MSRFTDKLSRRGGTLIKLLFLIASVANLFRLVDLTTFDDNQQQQHEEQQFPAASLRQERAHPPPPRPPLLFQQPPRIMIAIVSYDRTQHHHLDRLLDSIRHDICAGASLVDVVIYTTVVWPVSSFDNDYYNDWGEGCGGGTMEIKIKAPSWKKRLVNFHRELFYQQHLNNKYDLFVYTEDDHLLQMRHIFGFLRETQRLQEMVGADRFADYSIGVLRYEEAEDKKIIWEHHWDLSEGFDSRHLIHISGRMHNKNQNKTKTKHYFNGGGPYHQGMFMATPQQLVSWRDRPPDCRFNTTWFLERPERREKVSSLHLFSKEGCNVTQLIPVEGYQDFLVHHMSNTQHKVLSKYYVPNKDDGSVHRPTSITSTQLGSWLRRSSSNRTTASAEGNKTTKVRMYNDETQKKDPAPDLSEYKKWYGE